ncbi:MAG TPA: hypothetical protein VLK29_09500 [Luteimonas sp.]|nr:hypothetical protein [Luteimonas sp.]
MTDFLRTALAFPTLPYSVLLAVCVAYWTLAATGLFGADGADTLLAGDGDADGASGAAALLSRMGLSGVPLMVILTVLAFIGWLGTYFVHLLVLSHVPAGVRVVAGAAIALAMLVPGLFATSLLLRPMARLLLRLRPPTEASLLGQVAVVTSPSVDAGYGLARFDDGGAGLVLQVRHAGEARIARGDRVALIEYLDAQHAYRVIPERQFQSV